MIIKTLLRLRLHLLELIKFPDNISVQSGANYGHNLLASMKWMITRLDRSFAIIEAASEEEALRLCEMGLHRTKNSQMRPLFHQQEAKHHVLDQIA